MPHISTMCVLWFTIKFWGNFNDKIEKVYLYKQYGDLKRETFFLVITLLPIESIYFRLLKLIFNILAVSFNT